MRQKKAEEKSIKLPELIIKEEPIDKDEEYMDHTVSGHETTAKDEVKVPEKVKYFFRKGDKFKIFPTNQTQSPPKIAEISHQNPERCLLPPQQSTSMLKISKVQSILIRPSPVNKNNFCLKN